LLIYYTFLGNIGNELPFTVDSRINRGRKWGLLHSYLDLKIFPFLQMARHFAFDDKKQDQESASSSSFSHITHERILKVLNK
jgi:hypothetical protein